MPLWRKVILALVIGAILYAIVARFFPTVVYLPTKTINGLLSAPSTIPVASTRGEAVTYAGAAVQGITAANGFTIRSITSGLNGPRGLAISPGGTLLVTEMGGGAVSVIDPETGKSNPIIIGLKRPHGIVFYGGKLYVAEEQKLMRYTWEENTRTATMGQLLFSLPQGGRHFTRSLAFDKDGRLFISIGSTCDVCNEPDPRLAAVLVTDADGRSPRIFSKGLRNTVFMAINPKSNEPWGTEMGRDFLGDDLPPDEINILRDGADYGWPNCYGDRIFDLKGPGKDASVCANTQPPTYKIQAHSAPLGLTFINSPQFPADWQGDLLVSYHGSWNRSVPDGYKIVHIHVDGNSAGQETDFVTGFLARGNVTGRPVGLIFDASGNLYFTDDQGGRIFKVFRHP